VKRILLASLALVALLQVDLSYAQRSKPSLFINLTSDNVDRASQAINLGHLMLKEKKIPVVIWLNVEAVRLVDKRVMHNLFSDARTPLEKLQAFMHDGGKVMICPMCMRNIGGMEAKDLPVGVTVSEMEPLYNSMFSDGAKVISY
jgi:predicted peroxiredoxin